MTHNEHKKGYKNTALGWIPEEWEVVKLEDVTAKIQDGTHFSPKTMKIGDYKYITSKNIRTGYLKLDNVEYISKEDHEKIYKRCDVKHGDILLTKDGASTGNACLNSLKEPFSLLSSVALIRADFKRTTNEYLFQFIISSRGQHKIKDSMAGQAITRITLSKLKKFKFIFPPLPEQQKIATILSTWDQAIQTLSQLIEAKETQKQGLMQRLLTGKVRVKGFKENKEWQKTKFGVYPNDWRVKKISDVAHEISKKNVCHEDFPVLSCTKHFGLVDSLKYFGKQIFSKDTSVYKVVSNGQFAYATNHIEEGSIGYQNMYDKALISPMYTAFETDSDINDFFFYKLLKSELFIHKYQVNTSASVARRGSLRWKVFSQIQVVLPTKSEQDKIAVIVKHADHEIQLLNTQLEALWEQKFGLMQQLLTGRVRVQC